MADLEESPVLGLPTHYQTLGTSSKHTHGSQEAGRRSWKWPAVAVFSACIAVLAVFIAWTVIAHDDDGGCLPAAAAGYGRDVATSRVGVVSSEHYLATEAGLAVLAAGGNAVDAAAAVQFALNVVQPQSTGIGGGALVLVYNATTQEVHALDGREEAPESMTQDAFCADPACTSVIPFYPDRVTGGHAVGVPGTLRLVARALRDYGTTTLADATAPAIGIATSGFPMYDHLLTRINSNVDRLALYNASAELFLNSTRDGPKAQLGETWRNPDLAATLQLIADQGEDVLYDGEVGADIMAAVQDAVYPGTGLNGNISASDLRNYRAVLRKPVSVSYTARNQTYTVVGHNLPGSGGLTIGAMMGLLEGSGLPSTSINEFAALKLFIDAQNIAFSDRNGYMGDADFVDVPVDGFTNKTYLAQRRRDLMRVGEGVPIPIAAGAIPGAQHAGCDPVTTELDKRSTTHFSVVDAEGNAVAWTTTIEENLGSAVVVPGRGFLLNNELTDMDANPFGKDGCLRPNRPDGSRRPRRTALGSDATTVGGKRPLSSMSPTIVFGDGDLRVLALGSPGGSTIPGSVSHVLFSVLAHNATLRDAIDSPRTFARNSITLMEAGLYDNTDLVTALEAAGFEISGDLGRRPQGFVQAVMQLADGLLVGAADTARLDVASAQGL